MLWIIAGVVVLGAALWGPLVSNVEQAKYTVVQKQGNIEIRDYATMIVAEVKVSGDREKAINQGFRIIADYIFGNNISMQKVAMTAPVTQQQSERIDMTAPVTQQGEGNSWKVRFVMPAGQKMQTLPKPNNEAVKLEEIPVKRFAVIRFSGLAGKESLKTHTDELNTFIHAKSLTALSAPTYAFYNPPWTMERPALQQLLEDIRDRKIDTIVVYKVDRLTRSLADFAKMVELFDAQNVSAM